MSRDGARHKSMADLPQERRAGYAWYNTRGTQLAEAYAKWKTRVGSSS
jgi:hypothetical protein